MRVAYLRPSLQPLNPQSGEFYRSPLYFVRSGGISITHKQLQTIGKDGYQCSSTAGRNSDGIYQLYISSNSVNVLYGGFFARYYGLPLRCLAS